MRMTTADADGIRSVILEGRLDITGAQEIDVRFAAATSNQARLAIDLRAVEYIASIGIRLLVVAGKAAARRGGKMVLFGATEPVAKVLGAAGITEIIPLVDGREAALAALA